MENLGSIWDIPARKTAVPTPINGPIRIIFPTAVRRFRSPSQNAHPLQQRPVPRRSAGTPPPAQLEPSHLRRGAAPSAQTGPSHPARPVAGMRICAVPQHHSSVPLLIYSDIDPSVVYAAVNAIAMTAVMAMAPIRMSRVFALVTAKAKSARPSAAIRTQ